MVVSDRGRAQPPPPSDFRASSKELSEHPASRRALGGQVRAGLLCHPSLSRFLHLSQ
jgi:hypothetical protein